MKTIARRLLAPLAAALLLAGAAAAQTPTLASRLVGHWSLVSVAIGDQKAYGADPKGSMFFDAAGHYAVSSSRQPYRRRRRDRLFRRICARRGGGRLCRCMSTPATAPARRGATKSGSCSSTATRSPFAATTRRTAWAA